MAIRTSILLLVLMVPFFSALADPLPMELTELETSLPGERAARSDTTWYFAPSGSGVFGAAGTDERGYTFNGTGECSPAGWMGFGSDFVTIRENDFIPGTNETCLWTFFDPETTTEDYPWGIIPYGPPYLDMHIESPPLELAASGLPMSWEDGDGEILVSFDAYMDMPLSMLVFISLEISLRWEGDSYWAWIDPFSTVYYGEDGWRENIFDVTETVRSAGGSSGVPLAGMKIAIHVLDLCPLWCNVYGDGSPRTMGPMLDNIRLGIASDATAAPENGVPGLLRELTLQPNPFNPETRLRFSLTEAAEAELTVHDLSGRKLQQLAAGRISAGEHVIEWDGGGLPSGVCLIRWSAGVESLNAKAILLK